MDHPAHELLEAFGLGTLDELQTDRVAGHVESCDECCRKLAELPRDGFLDRLRGADTDLPWDESPDSTPRATTSNQAGRIPKALRDHGRYRVLQWIGRGGMGDVFKAEHRVMGNVMALKVIRPELIQHDGAVRRFHQEVQAAARQDSSGDSGQRRSAGQPTHVEVAQRSSSNGA